MIASATSRPGTLLVQAAELARLLLKSSQPPRELVSTHLHRQKRLTSAERQFVSAAAHHALRCWRFATACATGADGDVDLRPSDDLSRAVLAAAILLASDRLLPALSLPEDIGFEEPALLSAAEALFAESTTIDVATLRLRASQIDARAAGIVGCASEQESGRAPEKTSISSEDSSNSFEEENRRIISVRWSLPDWVVRAWREQQTPLSFSLIARIGQAFCTPAPLTLRVNNLRIERTGLIETLSAAGIDAAPHPLLGDAVVLPERAALLESEWYRDGLFEVQDAGSQLIGVACGVRPGMDILDACAGGGGKTMHLADMMRDEGTITATDIERSKLRGLAQRAQRLGLRSVQTMAVTADGNYRDDTRAFPQAAFDCVLVDAPCSGFGTVRRNPAHKWRLSEKTVTRLAERQAAILARFAEALRPGGTLLYATCSLLPHENSAIVAHFRSSRPDFSPAPIAPSFDSAGLGTDFLSPSASELLVLPDIFDSDGFYIAKFRRKDG